MKKKQIDMEKKEYLALIWETKMKLAIYNGYRQIHDVFTLTHKEMNEDERIIILDLITELLRNMCLMVDKEYEKMKVGGNKK